MLQRLFLVCSLIINSCTLLAQGTEIAYTIFLIGDAGEPFILNSPIGAVLRQKISASANQATILYLGDNIYPAGLPDTSSKYYNTATQILGAQVGWIKGLSARGIFVPGNHDWAHWGRKGFDHMRYQQQWLDSLHDEQIRLLPRDGCPGPVEVPITNDCLLVILDTQWLLHRWKKPEEDGACDAKTKSDVLRLLADIFQRHSSKRIIIAGHHPIITYGVHGGVFNLKQHLFPLTEIIPFLYLPMPVIGSIYPLYRKWFGHHQDTPHPRYKEFAHGVESIMKKYPGSIYVAGHEHALQYSIKDSVHYVVSGSAAKREHVRKKGYAQFADDVTGFAKLAIHQDGSVTTTFFQVDDEFPSGKEVFIFNLRKEKVR